MWKRIYVYIIIYIYNMNLSNFHRFIITVWPRQAKGPPTVSLSKTVSWMHLSVVSFFKSVGQRSQCLLSALCMFPGTHAISATVPIVDLSVFRWSNEFIKIWAQPSREECRKDFAFKQSNASCRAITTYSNDCMNQCEESYSIIEGEGVSSQSFTIIL